MQTNFLLKSILILFSATTFFVSCNKLMDPAVEKQIAIDAVKAELYRIDIANITMQMFKYSEMDFSVLKTNGVIITRDTPGNKITVDFGAGVKGTMSNHTFAGVVTVTHNGKKENEAGFEATTNISKLTIDGAKFETDDYLKVYVKEATADKITWMMDGKLKATLSAGGFISEDVTGDISSGIVLVQDKGVSTPNDNADDNFIMNGNVTGVASNGNTYSLKINNVTKTPSCKYPTIGSFDFSNSGNLEKIDFSAGGACDSKVKMTYSGIDLEFSVN